MVKLIETSTNVGLIKVIFIEPTIATIATSHFNIMDDTLNIDIGIFCNDMFKGGEKWLNELGVTHLSYTNSLGRL
jgi:hypothetical protein